MFNEAVCSQPGCEARQCGGERKRSSVIRSHLSSSFPPSQPEGLDSRSKLQHDRGEAPPLSCYVR